MDEKEEKSTVIGNTNVVSDKQIADWKKKWAKVYKTVIDGHVFYWRNLRRSEYVNIMAEIAAKPDDNTVYNSDVAIMKKQALITSTVTLYPVSSVLEKICEEEAGIATSLAMEALDRSGFDVQETVEL